MNARTATPVFDLLGMTKDAAAALLGWMNYRADWARVTLDEMRLILAAEPAERLFSTLAASEGMTAERMAAWELAEGEQVFDVAGTTRAVLTKRAAAAELKRPASPAAAYVDAALAKLGQGPFVEELPGSPIAPPGVPASTGWPFAAGSEPAAAPAAPAPAPVATRAPVPAPKAAAAPADALEAATRAFMEAMAAAGQKATPVDAAQVSALVADGVKPVHEALHRLAGNVDSAFDGLKANTEALDMLAGRVSELASAQAQRVTLTIKTADEVKGKIEGEHTHPMFEKVLRLVSAGLNVMMVGPAGSGKTHLAEQVARALNRKFGSISFTSGASEAQMVGWLLPTGEGGRFEYAPSQFVELYEGGESLFLMDEMDRGDANMLMIGNSALANDYLNVPQRRHAPTVRRGKNAGVIAAVNTHGTGQSYVYAAANVLDGATLDRFYCVAIDYDAAFEAALVGKTAASVKWVADASDAAADCAALHEWVGRVRAGVERSKLNRVVSTRMLQKGMAARRAGVPLAEVKNDLLSGWTRDELTKAGA
jgi:cobaltochelatase CobS